MTDAHIEVKHGYTLRDLHQMTAAAMAADRSMAMDYTDRRDIAWSAIAEALCEAPHWPKRSTLIQAGWQAIYRAVREEYRQHGYADRDRYAGYATAPRYLKYWRSGPVPSHEDRIVERIAAAQVLATLTPANRDAIIALAAHGDYQAAANSLGINLKAFNARIAAARRRLLARWHEGETPRKERRTDRRVEAHGRPLATRCGRGHEWTPENTRTRQEWRSGRLRTSRECRACGRERRRGGAS